MTDLNRNVKITLFGESHGAAVGAVLEGLPAGRKVDEALLTEMMEKRAPGRDKTATARYEADIPEILSGVKDGLTTGAPLAVIVRNNDARSKNYDNIARVPRPGHADLAAYYKYDGFNDVRGGGHFSARVTAPLVAAGAIAIGILKEKGIEIGAHILKVNRVEDSAFDPVHVTAETLKKLSEKKFPVLNAEAEREMRDCIEAARLRRDSVGGVVECAVTGLPNGTGAPHLNGLDSAIAKMIFGLPAVKALEFGEGFRAAELYGTENNDAYYYENGEIVVKTNHAGGVTGGITFGAPVVFRAAFKPTPSVASPQPSVDLRERKNAELTVEGRHDPCVVLRAVPVVIAATAIAVLSVLEEDSAPSDLEKDSASSDLEKGSTLLDLEKEREE